jgi:hypothetical protein
MTLLSNIRIESCEGAAFSAPVWQAHSDQSAASRDFSASV